MSANSNKTEADWEPFVDTTRSQVFINFGREVQITGSQVIIQVGDSNVVKAEARVGDLTSQVSTDASTAEDENVYMDMEEIRDTVEIFSIDGGSSVDSHDVFDENGRRDSESSKSSGCGTSSSGCQPVSISDFLYLRDRLPSVSSSDMDQIAPRPKRLALPIPPRLVVEAAENAQGFRTDVDIHNGIPSALKQVYTILRPFRKNGSDGHFVLWKFDKCIVALSVTYLRKVVNFAIQYDGLNFYLLDDGPMEPTISELINMYIRRKTKLCLKNKIINENNPSCDVSSYLDDNSVSIEYQRSTSSSGSTGSTGPKLPAKPRSFLHLRKPVDSRMIAD